ncbi:RNA polymerase sigma factor [Litchfieldia alkalitelluris]|uniref:RNA polymerase sigma factor n=1 Tax=Litchfieldia alkalitelluris TaxID=304268 RepID=UPI0009983941
MEDEKLIEKAIAGNEQAFRLLVEKYRHYLYKVVYPVVRNEKDAEDVTQETFIKIYYALPKYQKQGFKTWITRIAMNTAIDVTRKQVRKQESAVDDEILKQVTGTEVSAAVSLLRKEQREVVRTRIKELPDNYRDVIEDYYITEKNYKQIAEEQNVAVKTVEVKLHRARKWIKKHWKEDDF